MARDDWSDELAGLVLDDDFVQAAHVKEPAASERQQSGPIAAPPRPQRHRQDLAATATGSWLTRVRRRLPGAVVGVLVLALLLSATGGGNLFGRRSAEPGGDSSSPPDANPQPAAPSVFAGTPADGLPTGMTGLRVPPAMATASFSTAEVALAVDSVRQAVAAAALDPDVVSGTDSTPYLRHVGPDTRHAVAGLLTGGPADGPTAARAADYLTRFPPAVRLSSGTIKVTGTITYEPVVGSPHQLALSSRHVFAYAVEPATGGETEIVVVRRDSEWLVERTGAATVSPPEVTATASAATGACRTDDQGYVWPASTGTGAPAGTVAVSWDVSTPLTAACFAPLA